LVSSILILFVVKSVKLELKLTQDTIKKCTLFFKEGVAPNSRQFKI